MIMETTKKRPLPMLFAGIAMILFAAGKVIYNGILLISYCIEYSRLIAMDIMSTDELGRIMLSNLYGFGVLAIYALVIAVVGVLFIVVFIKPGRTLYCVSFGALGLAGVIYAIIALAEVVIHVLTYMGPVLDSGFSAMMLVQLFNGYYGHSPIIHWLPALLMTAFALLCLSPKARNTLSKLWFIPVILSGVQALLNVVVFGFLTSWIVRFALANVLVNTFNSFGTIGFTVCLIFAGLGMSSVVKNNWLEKKKETQSV